MVAEFSKKSDEVAALEKRLLETAMSLLLSIEDEVRQKLKKAEAVVISQQAHLSVEIFHREVQLESTQQGIRRELVDVARERQQLELRKRAL